MTRKEIERSILRIFREQFEIENPGLEDDLREVHDFDSIDAIELLTEIEDLLGMELTQEQKKKAMDIRTIRQVCDYVFFVTGPDGPESDGIPAMGEA